MSDVQELLDRAKRLSSVLEILSDDNPHKLMVSLAMGTAQDMKRNLAITNKVLDQVCEQMGLRK